MEIENNDPQVRRGSGRRVVRERVKRNRTWKRAWETYRLAGRVQSSAVHPPGELGRRPGPVRPARQLVFPPGRQRLQLTLLLYPDAVHGRTISAFAFATVRQRRHFRGRLRERRRLQIVVDAAEPAVFSDR